MYNFEAFFYGVYTVSAFGFAWVDGGEAASGVFFAAFNFNTEVFQATFDGQDVQAGGFGDNDKIRARGFFSAFPATKAYDFFV